MRIFRLLPLWAAALPFAVSAAEQKPYSAQTRLGIEGARWTINGRITYPGAEAEGLLMNVRMVNSTFEDRVKPEFDPDANTSAFLARLDEYKAHGALAFTLCLQGGHCGYEGAINSAFRPDGSLRRAYLDRVARVIEACDARGMAAILSCYYQRQDQILRDEAAVRRGVAEAAKWIARRGYANVALEIANEFPHSGFDHAIIRDPEGEAELIRLAREANPDLLVSSSGLGTGKMADAVSEAADFILIHFNETKPELIPERIEAVKRFGKPIVCNEDQKLGATAVEAMRAAVASGASWGFMHAQRNQYWPFEFSGAADDPLVYGAMQELTARR
ncbi:MAG: hypothetical protein BWZ10_03441 [candidate division BRC1 bacterium ADurb.BinA364]|nr:MAG: hypothetical protein BWZ10_03441 [candidate division BRC1 bacterium ADurb.BinA364]